MELNQEAKSTLLQSTKCGFPSVCVLMCDWNFYDILYIIYKYYMFIHIGCPTSKWKKKIYIYIVAVNNSIHNHALEILLDESFYRLKMEREKIFLCIFSSLKQLIIKGELLFSLVELTKDALPNFKFGPILCYSR